MDATRETHELGELADSKLQARKGVQEPKETADGDGIFETKLVLKVSDGKVVR